MVEIRETAGLLLAAGIDPSQSVLYLQSKYKVLMEDPDNIEHLLIEGAEKIRPIADSVLNTVKKGWG